jgi:hypothetical protein
MSIIVRSNTASFTRPGDTTAYAAGDVVGPVTSPANLTFTLGQLGGGGNTTIRYAQVVKGSATVTVATFNLWLFTANPTPIADNSPWTYLIANMDSTLGVMPIEAPKTGGTGSTAALGTVTLFDGLYIPVSLSSSTIYGVLTAGAAYVPLANETFAVTLGYEVQTTNQF